MRGFANVKDEKIAIEGRTAHQVDFVFADFAECGFDVGLLPVVAVNRNGDGVRTILNLKQAERAKFNGAVGESVVAWSSDHVNWWVATLLQRTDRECRRNAPVCRKITKQSANGFTAPIRSIEQNHGRIDEGVLAIELRREGAGRIPEDGVADDDCAVGASAPGEFVDFFDGQLLMRFGFGGDLLDAAAEIADLIKGIPGRHLQEQFTVDVRDAHGDVEEVFRRIGERHLIFDEGSCGLRQGSG